MSDHSSIISYCCIEVKKYIKGQAGSLLAIGAAFSFTIMMYNVPIPDGTTAHAVGAIILGPLAATVGVSIALIIQAFFFGDGGILTLGANILNMAFVIPFVSYFLYRLISSKSEIEESQVIVGIKKYWYALVALIIFAPIGLLAQGAAFGEWSGDDLKSKLGYIPQGMANLVDKWKALLPDYSIPGFDTSLFKSSLGYIFCAIVALVLILAITGIISLLMKRKNVNQNISS